MRTEPFKEYFKESEPGKRDKGYAWHTARGRYYHWRRFVNAEIQWRQS